MAMENISIEEINTLIRSQESDYNEIRQLYTSIRKDSAKRKTNKYVNERRTRLTEIFDRVSTNHEVLKVQQVLADHKYITTNYYENISSQYRQAIEYLASCEKREQLLDTLYNLQDVEEDVQEDTNSPKIFIQLYRITQMQKKLNTAAQAVAEDKPAWYWETLMKAITEQWQEIEKTHLLILMDNSTLDHSYFRNNLFEKTQTEYELIIERVTAKAVTCRTDNSQQRSILPRITIPIFSGNCESWDSFYDLFLKVIHRDNSISATEKMQYLKTHVRGEAFKLIKHLTVCDANYDAAWSLLIKRYRNERVIVARHIDNIINIPKINKATATSLKMLHDTLDQNIEALKSHDVDVTTWDPILGRILSRTWDLATNDVYEQQLNEPNKPQSFAEMMAFLEKRFKCMENSDNLNRETRVNNKSRYETTAAHKIDNNNCWYCQNKEHSIYHCIKFKQLCVEDRVKAVKDKGMCRNCLAHQQTIECRCTKRCQHCDKTGHHSYLHQNNYKKPNRNTTTRTNMHTNTTTTTTKTILLATALVNVQSIDGTTHLLRVLCDQGSEASFCTENVAQLLAFPRNRTHVEVMGIADDQPKTANHSIEVKLRPRFPSEYELTTTLIVLPKLTGAIPNNNVQPVEEKQLDNKIIADPTYYKRGPIDIILGAHEYGKLLLQGLHKINEDFIAQDTQLGWILSGIASNGNTKAMKITTLTTKTKDIPQLTKFWELEEVPGDYQLSADDRKCEEFYNRTTIRNIDGSYTVRLPFKKPEIDYGNSRSKAAARLIQLEKRFLKDKHLQEKYQEFLNEYLDMGHMRKVPKAQYNRGKYYIPHQPVIKEDSLTTKLRVVFDASSKSSTNVNLNENMLKGPRLQSDLTTILLRWRKHKIVFMADIEKMYRFIKVNEEDLTYQRILWRESPKQQIDEYELTTVTYGTASAPYLAVKTLQKLAVDEQQNFPYGSEITLQDFYVDDVLSGGDTVQKTKLLQNEVIQLLKKGGFNLRKWSSNSEELLDNIPKENQEDQMLKIPLDETRKSLGVLWSPKDDSFRFEITVNKKENPTKRFILSEIAKLFDPLGWLAPVIVPMKLIIQELWTKGLEWDQRVDETIRDRWIRIQDQLRTLETITIPRWCHSTPETNIELHGFCDASEKAYGAVVYCRVQNNDKLYQITLLQAKSKVAPQKQKTTLPKLELCSALLLAQLMGKVITTMKFPRAVIYCWTDSMIALGWIKGEVGRWKTFVANRVAEIQRLLPQAKWNHVVTSNNPADVISRGIEPSKLQDFTLWWNGPDWLRTENLPVTKTTPEICEEIKRSLHITLTTTTEPTYEIWERFSSFQKMVRVLSYCLRIKSKVRNKEPLTSEELAKTTNKILTIVQQHAFHKEQKALTKGTPLEKGNKLSNLDPFISPEDKLLRVGGRLQNSSLPYNQKHPIVLPSDHHVTWIMIRDAHLKTLHGGNTLTLAYLRQKYWIVGGKKKVKSYISKCVRCLRYRKSAIIQKMGILPRARVTESFPFSHTGVDYAGPIQIRATKGRGYKSCKGYIAVFVCLATKAIHLELAGDLSTESFIAAFQRFTSRRGPVSHMYSDNATNFIGAASQIYKEMLEITQSDEFQNTMATVGTQWHFIPPSSPHFGGIWEAGVKSMKHHLRRVIGEQTLTFEEMTTFLHQVEACLNSRPLCAQSEDINDNVVLTPSHFLIGREAVGIPDPIASFSTDLSYRWKQIQRMKRDFWKSWTKDYLHQLQQRYKWKTNTENLDVGKVVLVKDENISPSRWPLAKVKEIHTGTDGLTRVVTLQKATGTTQKRAIHKLIPLPVNANGNNIEPRSITTTVQSNTSITSKNRRNKGCTLHKGWQWLMLLFMCLQLIVNATAAYTLKNVKPGFYVEQIGTASVDRGVFRIETTFRKDILEQNLIKLKKAVARFSELCSNATETMGSTTHCDQYYHHLKESESKFERTKEYLIEANRTRKKRGILGQLLTSVFGVNDEAYRDIDALNKNQQQLIEAANHQTKFMITTVSQINETESRITKKLQKFQKKLDQVIKFVYANNNWYTNIDRNQINIQIIETYQLAQNYIAEITEHYDGLLTVYLSKSSVYSILTPKNVSNLITAANQKLPSNIKIVHNQLLETRMSENDTHIQVYAYFPIQDTTKYTMIYVTAVPEKTRDRLFQTIEIQKSYICLDYNNEQYFDLDHTEFTSCIKKTNDYICFPSAVKNMQSNENCIVNQIFKNNTQTKCQSKTFDMTTKVLWKQLYMQNTWLFIVKNRCTTSVICDGQREEIELREVGVIRIADNCIIKTPTNILAAKRIMSVQTIASFSKEVNFSVSTYNNNNTVFNLTKNEVIESSQDILQNIVNSEHNLQSQLDNSVWTQITNHTYTTTITTGIVVIILIVLIFCCAPQITKRMRSMVRSPRSDHNTTGVAVGTTNQAYVSAEDTQHEPVYSQVAPKKPTRKRDRTHIENIELYQLESCPGETQNVQTIEHA